VAETDRLRIEIAFDGGQVMSAHVQTSTADEVEQALDSGVGGTVHV